MEGMAKNPQQLSAKLKHLFGDTPRQELADLFGVHRAAIQQYIRDEKPNTPGPGVLFAIAKHYGIALDWLLDDDLPVEEPRTSIQMFSEFDLIRELARHYRSEVLRILESIEAAEKGDVRTVAEAALSIPVDAPLPSDIDAGMSEAPHCRELIALVREKYSLENVAYNCHDEMPGSSRPAESLFIDIVEASAAKLIERNPKLLWLKWSRDIRAGYQMFPARRDHYEKLRGVYLQRVQSGETPDPLDAPIVVDAQVFAPGSAQAKAFTESAIARRDRKRKGKDADANP